VTANFTGSFFQFSRSSLHCFNAVSSPTLHMLSFNILSADVQFSSLDAI
jgi:hypothetical protein